MRRSFVSTTHVTPEYVHILYVDGAVVIVLSAVHKDSSTAQMQHVAT